jgi:integrase
VVWVLIDWLLLGIKSCGISNGMEAVMEVKGIKLKDVRPDYCVATITDPKSTIHQITYHRLKGKLWQVRFWDTRSKKQIFLQRGVDGRPLRSSNDCIHVIIILKEDGYNPKSWGKDKSYNFNEAVQPWIKSPNISPEWKEQRRQVTNRFFLPHFGKMDIRDVKTSHIRSLYSKLLDKKYGAKYIKNVIGEIKNFFNFYRKSLKEMPDFPKVQVQEPVIKWLTEKEQTKVFKCIPASDKPIFEAMRHYGLRTNEAGGLLKKNVFLDHDPPYFVIATTISAVNGQVKPVTKTKRIRPLPIIPETRPIFKSNNDSPLMFTKNGRPYTNRMLNRVWNKAIKESGVQKINLQNGVRHTFAMLRLNEGFSMSEVQAILGHTSSNTTQRYAAYTLQSLQDIIRGKVHTKFIVNTYSKPIDIKGRIRLGGKDSNLG